MGSKTMDENKAFSCQAFGNTGHPKKGFTCGQ
jgi:hypothetical protein